MLTSVDNAKFLVLVFENSRFLTDSPVAIRVAANFSAFSATELCRGPFGYQVDKIMTEDGHTDGGRKTLKSPIHAD